MLHEELWDVAYQVGGELRGDDQVAVMAFDTSAEVIVKPVHAEDYARVFRVLTGFKRAPGPTDLAHALDEARAYIAPAPGRKLVVLLTNKARIDDKVEAALAAMRSDGIAFVVAGTLLPDTVTLEKLAKLAGGTFTDSWHEHDVPTKLEAAVRALHDR